VLTLVGNEHHRLQQYGANTVAEAPRLDIINRIAKRFAEPLVAILLVAAAISGATGVWDRHDI
jgi:Mg2+-importing ATPase